jgi:hypothetical protein
MAGREQGPFAIQIADRVDGELKPRGSGCVLGDGLVLTAWHVVEGLADPVVRVGPHGEALPILERIPSEVGAHDLVLLRVGGKLPQPAPWAAVPVKPHQPVEIDGYPIVNPREKSSFFEQASGETFRMESGDDILNLILKNEVLTWSGMSGAAVRLDGRVVAVVAGARAYWQATEAAGTNRLVATPLQAVVNEPWFRKAMSATVEDQRSVRARTPAAHLRRPTVAERKEIITLILAHLPRFRPAEELGQAVAASDLPDAGRLRWSDDARSFVSHLVVHCERYGLAADGRTGLQHLAAVARTVGSWGADDSRRLAELTGSRG